MYLLTGSVKVYCTKRATVAVVQFLKRRSVIVDFTTRCHQKGRRFIDDRSYFSTITLNDSKLVHIVIIYEMCEDQKQSLVAHYRDHTGLTLNSELKLRCKL